MKKFLVGILVIVIISVVTLVFGRNILARAVVIDGIKKTCGLKVEIAKVDIGLPRVAISGLKIYNPAGFRDKMLADIPEISLEMDLPAFFKNKIHLGKLKLYVRELDVSLNEQGKLNVNSLALLLPKPGGGKPPDVKIDELSVKIEKVNYQGYLPAAGAQTMAFNPDVDETFHDVTNPQRVASEILQRIISRIGVGKFATFDVQGGVEKVAADLGAAAKKTIDDAAQGVQGLFGAK